MEKVFTVWAKTIAGVSYIDLFNPLKKRFHDQNIFPITLIKHNRGEPAFDFKLKETVAIDQSNW